MLNERFATLVKHMVNRSILTIWYSFALADSIEDEFTFLSLLKSNYVHRLRSWHANVIINSSYYQLLAFSLANYRK